MGVQRTAPASPLLPGWEWVSKEEPAEGASSECAICLEPLGMDGSIMHSLPCLHSYHPACIREWWIERRRQCPLCLATPKDWE